VRQQCCLRNVLTALAAALLLGGCGGVLDPAGPIDGAELKILLNAVAIMLAIVIPTIIVTLAFAWWYRASNTRARYLPRFTYSGRLELIVWSIPALAVFFLGGIAWISSHELDPAHPLPGHTKPLEIEVVSLDWKWLFIYPQQGVASVNQMVVPVGTPLHLRLTSASVFNVFWVPRLGSEIYTMNGMAAQLYLQADATGVYRGLSGHFSGDGFSDMTFDVRAVSTADFTHWVAQTRGRGPSLDEASYRLLLRQSQNVKPYTYGAVTPDLFEAVMMQKLPPGEGPPANPTPLASKGS
jgi:cytochrome o ubiquinol oxidase subunit 2